MHEKCFKIDFFANFRKLQKKLPICKKRYAEILHVARAVVTIVEKNEKRRNRIFFGSHFEEQSVVFCTAEIAVFPYLCYSGSIANFQAKKSKIYFFEINRFF